MTPYDHRKHVGSNFVLFFGILLSLMQASREVTLNLTMKQCSFAEQWEWGGEHFITANRLYKFARWFWATLCKCILIQFKCSRCVGKCFALFWCSCLLLRTGVWSHRQKGRLLGDREKVQLRSSITYSWSPKEEQKEENINLLEQ